jgi:hypothetical protein
LLGFLKGLLAHVALDVIDDLRDHVYLAVDFTEITLVTVVSIQEERV